MVTHKPLVVRSVAFAALALTTSAVAHGPKSATPMAGQLPPATGAAAIVVDKFHAALKRGDTTVAAALLADDALIFESGGAERSKAEYASHHLAADAAFASATTHKVNKRSGSTVGEFAWIATEGATNGTYKNRTISSVSTETMVLRRANGSWRIVHIHWSSASAK